MKLTNKLLLALMLTLCINCTRNLSSGDLIFVASENSDFEKSIVEVTKSKDTALVFTHVGIINVTDTGIFVVEAVPEKGVVYTSLNDFKVENVKRALPSALPSVKTDGELKEENRNGVLYVGKLKSKYKKYVESALNRACSHLGKGYDYAFDFANDLYYCSELVYDAYAHASGNPSFFETPNMTFKKEESDETLPFWVEYFEKQNIPIPEGKPGISPTGLSRSEQLRIKNYELKIKRL
jgi:hypothetical protein